MKLMLPILLITTQLPAMYRVVARNVAMPTRVVLCQPSRPTFSSQSYNYKHQQLKVLKERLVGAHSRHKEYMAEKDNTEQRYMAACHRKLCLVKGCKSKCIYDECIFNFVRRQVNDDFQEDHDRSIEHLESEICDLEVELDEIDSQGNSK